VSSSRLAPRAVANRCVTVDAVRRLAAGRAVTQDVVDKVFVAVETVALKDFLTYGPKTDRLREVLEGEALGVPETVLGLDQILGDRLVGDVAVVAGCHGVMTG